MTGQVILNIVYCYVFYPTRYRWEFDGTALPDDPRISVVDGVLTIQTPGVSDEGDYQCFATNKHGTALSSKYQAIYAFQDNYDEVGTLRQEVTEGEKDPLSVVPPMVHPNLVSTGQRPDQKKR
ncbi:putative contactin-2-like [Apostichopus japonicus]|uniref:Putative contactin-2-like n=1 Tax=Stichopus japonicus TaxID=307972 RepID=A0A2G8K353_STIJA|nr:putative contactin-2-like [Apostichopus japonicus]